MDFIRLLTRYYKIALAIALLHFSLSPLVSASEHNAILLVLSEDSRIYHDLYGNLKKTIHHHRINISYPGDITKELLDEHPLVVSAGTRAATAIYNYKTSAAVIHTLITKDFYKKVISKNKCPGQSCRTVYIDQPVKRYIKLTKILFGKNYVISLPITKSSTHDFSEITSIAKNENIKVRRITINSTANIYQRLENELSENDVLLALPDPEIYNRNTAKNIILSAYHKNTPIVAYSRSFAKAGALVSLYSSIENISKQTAWLINNINNLENNTEKSYYPDDFSLEINKSVARSLNIRPLPVESIKRKIKQ